MSQTIAGNGQIWTLYFGPMVNQVMVLKEGSLRSRNCNVFTWNIFILLSNMATLRFRKVHLCSLANDLCNYILIAYVLNELTFLKYFTPITTFYYNINIMIFFYVCIVKQINFTWPTYAIILWKKLMLHDFWPRLTSLSRSYKSKSSFGYDHVCEIWIVFQRSWTASNVMGQLPT